MKTSDVARAVEARSRFAPADAAASSAAPGQAASSAVAGRAASSPVPRQASFVLGLLDRTTQGRIELTLPDGSQRAFGPGPRVARIRLDNWNAFAASLRHGDIGFAESFIAGDWHTDALDDVLGVLVANRDVIEAAVYGTWWGRIAHRLRHLLNRNSKSGAKRNIHAHYDLGNAFYELWLDPGMTYSSALFEGDPARSLECAQQAKYARILERLALPEGARVLEIGCGWGAFAELAARTGLQVRGLTLSTEQLAYARQRLRAAGLDARASFALQDYRDETGRHDGIVSIEMFEAVGEAYWPAYFDTIARALEPSGRAVIQTITIADRLFERYRSGTDFIQQYVFPGGMLPCPRVFREHAQRAGLDVVSTHAFGRDYARTLATWRARFTEQVAAVRALGFGTDFIRLWEFYLAYCEAAFADGSTDVLQYTLVRR